MNAIRIGLQVDSIDPYWVEVRETIWRICQSQTEVILPESNDRPIELIEFELNVLGEHADTVLCEGGPSLNGQLAADGLVDELCLTLAPTLANGDSARIMHHPDPSVTPMRLAYLWEEGDSLFLRYVRAEAHPGESGRTSR